LFPEEINVLHVSGGRRSFKIILIKKNGTIEMADEKTWLRQEVHPAQHP
jgi:hypothetical protein